MKKLNIILISLVTLLLIATTNDAQAQSRHYNTQSMGMGGGGTSYVNGYHSNFINPANLLTKNRNNKVSLGIMGGVGARFGGSLANISVYNEYLTEGRLISGSIREDMLNQWFGTSNNEMRTVASDVSIVPFGLSINNSNQAFSLATRVRVINDININKGFAKLMFYGFDSDEFGTKTPVDLSLSLAALGEVSFAYARNILNLDSFLFAKNLKLNVGVAPKYLIGAYSLSMDMKSDLTISPASSSNMGSIIHDFEYNIFAYGDLSKQMKDYVNAKKTNKDAKIDDYVDYDGSDIGSLGSGFGLDMGVTAEMDISHIWIPVLNSLGKNKTLRLSMSITDLGSVSFKENPGRFYTKNTFVFDGDVGDSSIGDYFDNLGDSLANDIYGDFNSESLDSKKYSLPGMYNFGASLDVGKLMLAADFGFGFNNSGVNSKRSSLVLGAEYRFLNFIPLRVGTKMGGYSSAAYSIGTGLDFNIFEFTVAASLVKNSKNNGADIAAAYSGLVFRF